MGLMFSRNEICKCNEPAPTLSINTFFERNLYLSWSNQLVAPFSLRLNVGGFSQHQETCSRDTNIKGFFLTTRVSEVDINTLKNYF